MHSTLSFWVRLTRLGRNKDCEMREMLEKGVVVAAECTLCSEMKKRDSTQSYEYIGHGDDPVNLECRNENK